MKRLLSGQGGVLLLVAAVGIALAWRQLNRGPSTVLTSAYDPPCWHGIQPGGTDSVGVLNILTELPWVSGGTKGYSDEHNQITYRFAVYSTPWSPQKSASCVQKTASWRRAVASITLSAFGSMRSIKSFAALRAKSASRSATAPWIITATA